MSEPVSDSRILHRQAGGRPTGRGGVAAEDTRAAPLPPGIDGDAVYRRTERGDKAIGHSSRRVSRTAQRALNLFDGSRPLRDLPRIVSGDDLPGILRELIDGGLIEQVGTDTLTAQGPHPDTALARVKRALAGAFIRELGPSASVLEARVQDCVNLVVLHNVLQEITGLVAERKNPKAAERIRAIVRDHGLR